MDTGISNQLRLAGQVSLNYGEMDSAVIQNISGCAASDTTLWTVSDEGRTLERLTHSLDGYHLTQRFDLASIILGIPGDPDDELDLESLDIDGSHLWICGAHCRVRRKPGPNEIVNSEIRERRSRRILARITLDGAGTSPEEAQHVPFEGPLSLRSKLESDLFLSPFRELPTKENGIDIEGLAVIGPRIFVGLRGPVVGGLAIVMEVTLDPAFNVTAVRPFFLNFEGLGIRELTRDGDKLLITAGPVGEATGSFTLYQWTPGPDNMPRKVYSWGVSIEKPEGLCWCKVGNERGLLVLYDSPNRSRTDEQGVYRADWLKPDP